MTMDLRQIARSVYAEVLELDPFEIGDHDDFFDALGGDSLQKLTAVIAFEKRTGIRFSESEGRLLNTVEAMSTAGERLFA